MAHKKSKLTLENWDTRKFVIQTLRGNFRNTPMYHEAKNRAKRYYYEESKHGKPLKRVWYECAICKRCFRDENKQIAIDHINPIVDIESGRGTLEEWLDGLYCDVNGLQLLCNYADKDMEKHGGVRSCHKIKNSIESKQRSETRKRKKQKSGNNNN